MKKQIFTLLTLLLGVCSGAWADSEDFKYGTSTTSGSNYVGTSFTIPGTYILGNGSTKSGNMTTKGQKVKCVSNGTSKVIVINVNPGKKITEVIIHANVNANGKVGTMTDIKVDGTSATGFSSSAGNIPARNANSNGDSFDFTITDDATDNITMYFDNMGSDQMNMELFVTYETVGTQLDTPEITYVASTGMVTIGAVTNATKITYTTNGNAPTAESTTYSAPFEVEDGTVVKAIAIGTGSYASSEIATETVYRTGITCATPVIKKFNGAVAITSATPNATIKFSTNGGTTYDTYTRPFTLTADATVQAYAERENCTNSSEASEDVTVLASNKTKTIYLDYDDFTISSYTATGKTGTDAEGYVLTIGNTSKSWSSNGVNITTPDGVKHEFKLSNGAQNTLDIPNGVHVTKLTLYSFIHSDINTTANGWKEVGGTDYQTGDDDYRNVPMGAYLNADGYKTNPDVRVYDIDQTGGTITFTNAGNQLSFIIALDILEDNTTITPAKEYTTYVTPVALNFSGLELKAYVATTASSSVVTMVPVTTVPAGTPLILKKGIAASYDVPVAASATAPATNLLKVSNGVSTIGGDGVYDYILSNGKFYHASAGVLPAGKCYLHLDSAPGARELSMSFSDDETTDLSEELRVKSEEFATAIYDLQGRKVAQPTRGLYIVNGKKVVIK